MAPGNQPLLLSQATSATNISGRAATDQSFCVATTDSHVACWGANDFGQISNDVDSTSADAGPLCSGTNHCFAQPQQIASPLMTKVSTGDEGALGLGVDGKVYAWGSNANAQLGHVPGADAGDDLNCGGSAPCDPAPHVVSGLP